MLEAKEILSIDNDNYNITVLCNDDTIYLFNLNRMFQSDVPLGMQNTWKLLTKDNRFSNVCIVHGDIVWGTYCEILHSEITKYMEVMMNTKIYKDNNYTVDIDFTPKPALLNVYIDDDAILTVNINKEYISGNKDIYKPFISWLTEVNDKLEDIIWEWETGNDNFDLIDEKLVLN